MAKCTMTKKETAELEKLIAAFDAAKSELADGLELTATDWETETGDASEKWLESAAGQNAQARAEKMREWADAVNDLEIPNLEDLPE
jgi:hypothetical protein